MTKSGRKIASLMAIRDIQHRWNYTGAMLARSKVLREAINQWLLDDLLCSCRSTIGSFLTACTTYSSYVANVGVYNTNTSVGHSKSTVGSAPKFYRLNIISSPRSIWGPTPTPVEKKFEYKSYGAREFVCHSAGVEPDPHRNLAAVETPSGSFLSESSRTRVTTRQPGTATRVRREHGLHGAHNMEPTRRGRG
ncbi:hypothetical protein B0H14DRAFT_2583482 [Mycena olivaceomarginata]|nr:hypothetical protein B0H14DRAFT_2583482 [Mycena olivaceomarginata]